MKFFLVVCMVGFLGTSCAHKKGDSCKKSDKSCSKEASSCEKKSACCKKTEKCSKKDQSCCQTKKCDSEKNCSGDQCKKS